MPWVEKRKHFFWLLLHMSLWGALGTALPCPPFCWASACSPPCVPLGPVFIFFFILHLSAKTEGVRQQGHWHFRHHYESKLGFQSTPHTKHKPFSTSCVGPKIPFSAPQIHPPKQADTESREEGVCSSCARWDRQACKLTQRQEEAGRKKRLSPWFVWMEAAGLYTAYRHAGFRVVTCWSAITFCGGNSGRKEHMETLISTFTLLLLSQFYIQLFFSTWNLIIF